MTKEEFQNTLASFLDNNPKGELLLAKECEVSVSTVYRWVSGTANPHPRLREWIVSWTTGGRV